MATQQDRQLSTRARARLPTGSGGFQRHGCAGEAAGRPHRRRHRCARACVAPCRAGRLRCAALPLCLSRPSDSCLRRRHARHWHRHCARPGSAGRRPGVSRSLQGSRPRARGIHLSRCGRQGRRRRGRPECPGGRARRCARHHQALPGSSHSGAWAPAALAGESAGRAGRLR